MGKRFDWLVMGTGSTGTHAGLLAGFAACGSDLRMMGINVRQPQEKQIAALIVCWWTIRLWATVMVCPLNPLCKPSP